MVHQPHDVVSDGVRCGRAAISRLATHRSQVLVFYDQFGLAGLRADRVNPSTRLRR